MPNVFISYSRENSRTANRLKQKLQNEGIAQVFMDIDPEEGLTPGSKWAEQLENKIADSKALVILFSSEWSTSPNCRQEYGWAIDAHRTSGRPQLILPVLLWDREFAELASAPHEQLVDFNGRRLNAPLDGEEDSVGQEKALEELWDWLKGVFAMVGVLPTRPPFDPKRGPYRGLEALQEEDAAVFFGRESVVDETMDQLFKMRERSAKKLLTILAASGAGKSSLLRAGLIPRIKYHAGDFYCLPVFRLGTAAHPENADAFATLLHDAFQPTKANPALPPLPMDDAHHAVSGGVGHIEVLLRDLQRRVSAPDKDGTIVDPVTLVLPIDQGEELLPLASDNLRDTQHNEEARRFRAILSELHKRRYVDLITMIAIRSDSYPRFQEDKELGKIESELCDLRPLPQAAYPSVIKEPARIAGVELDSKLVHSLLHDVEGLGDGLPLLAFVLQRLLNNAKQEQGTDKPKLKLEAFTQLGGIGGAIKEVVEDTLGAGFDPQPLRHAFIPHLATVSEQGGAFLRRAASWTELPKDSHEVVRALVDKARLLVTRGEQVEVAHEAVLRQWKLLNGWLEEVKGALWFLGQAEQAASNWWTARNEITAKHGADSAETVNHDRNQLWLQDRLDDIWRALEQVGQHRDTAQPPLRDFIRPEFGRLLEELESPYVNHARRAEIGDRLASLGDRTIDNKRIAFGDLRPGVNCLTADRIDLAWKPSEDQGHSRSRQLRAWRQNLPDKAECIPDIVWCHVPKPSGPISVYTQAEEGEEGRGAPKGEPTPCSINSAFWVSKYPVSLEQFIAFTGERDASDLFKQQQWWTGFDGDQSKWFNNKPREQSTPKNYPAQYVSWYQAVAFCRWLTALYLKFDLLPPGGEIRLPFEAEWIQAATGGLPDRTYPWGSEWNPDNASNQGGFNRFVAAGLYPRGQAPTGALDMSGNVYEWCLNAFEDLNDPALTRQASRATKGGAYYTQARAGEVPHALSVHHRFKDNPLGVTPEGNRIAAGIRLVATGLAEKSPLLGTETLIT